MGKNQQHKMQQRSRAGGTTEGAPGEEAAGDGMVDGSFHSPAWHAARIAAMQSSGDKRMTWEEFKAKQDTERKTAEDAALAEEEETRLFRAQLDAERNKKLGRGINHAEVKQESKKRKRDKKDKKEKKDKKGKKEKKDKKEKKEKKSKKKKSKKSKKDQSSDSSDSGSDSSSDSEQEEEEKNPFRLSKFMSN
mmetsp:Transcript_25543/g.35225  ORF Transcript_25543/g.35225 Transcript_25543/m.35225 type:complete len:192 (+) Transcript_25543:280-855(+)|eukprot:CAMPEP_0196592774 /NCGR_PEP_ID=MMETSP1081-20130531/73751_1 /TAXON_ID=36882 /ORGANISM="Pyramimonas amylifera, Strain CCMP720" /LENGTH=191 /DNA_ID=CAMNT_0041916557 /DNA_START=280 /DNA_END=855 /DNA_ORIENTATION=+